MEDNRSERLLLRDVLRPDFDTLETRKTDVLIEDGRFVRFAPQIADHAARVVEGGGRLLLPAMVDTHTHMVQSLTKGPLDDLNITQWLTRMLRVQWSLNEEEWYWGVLLGCLQALRCGVTAINEMTYWPHIDAVAQAYMDCGIRATFGIGSTDIAENAQVKVIPLAENLRRAAAIYERYHGKGRLRTSVAPQGRPACTPELMRAMKDFARERGLIFHTHLAEGKAETQVVRAWTGRGEAEELDRLGVLDEDTMLAHVIWISEAEIDLLAARGAWVAHCPSTNMKLSDGIAPVARMLARGCHVAFGCDGEASSANRDLLREARHGSFLQKATTLDPTVLPAGQCYRMLTQDGARALGYRDLGRLEAGCLADFSLVRAEGLFTTNRARLLTNLLYAGDAAGQIDAVYIEGRPVVQDGALLGFSLPEVLAKCEEILARVEARLK